MFRYAPDNQWFIRTMNVVFEIGGDLVRKEVAHNLMRIIAEGVVTVSHDYLHAIPYGGLLLRGPNICEICEHHLDLQKFLLVAKDLNVFGQYFLS